MTEAKALMELVRARYGSLEAPDCSWTRSAFDASPHAAMIGQLRARFQVTDLTDPNDDVSVNVVVEAPGRAVWHLWLSLVGPFAALTRSGPTRPRVVSRPDGRDSDDSALVDALAAAGFEVLCREVLETPVGMPMFNAEPGEVTLFNALFTDADARPW